MHGIRCPRCDSSTRVIDTFTRTDHVTRQRLCKNPECSHFFETRETWMSESPTDTLGDHRRGLPCHACGSTTRVEQTRNLIEQVRRDRVCDHCGAEAVSKEHLIYERA